MINTHMAYWILMPTVKCPVCANDIDLDAWTYWNTGEEGALIACNNCKSRLKVWIKGGMLKNIEIVEEKAGTQ